MKFFKKIFFNHNTKQISNNIVTYNLVKYNVVQVIASTFFLFVCSQINIPLKPVPITLQTVAVLVIGLCLPKKNALESILLYIVLGAIGVPVFANFGKGFVRLLSPSGGYLIGFIVSVWVMAKFREIFEVKKIIHLVAVGFIGQFVLYTFGILWLSKFVGFDNALKAGLYPFILTDIVKNFLVSSIIRLLKIHSLIG